MSRCCFVYAVLACEVMLARQPNELLYEHKSTWGGFLKNEQSPHSANDLSINDMSLLKIAQRDIRKQTLAALKDKMKVSCVLCVLTRHFPCEGRADESGCTGRGCVHGRAKGREACKAQGTKGQRQAGKADG
jgi:hypothetical protein